MRKTALALALMVFAAPALAAASPEVEWKAGIADANLAFSKKPHAILKIQDAAYLGEGDVATLTGQKGKPDSYRWVAGSKPGVLTARYTGGHASVTMGGKTFDEATLGKSIPVDKDVDIAGYPTQVNAGVMGVRIFIYNQQAKAAKDFKGLDYFPYDASWRVSARFTPDPKLPAHVFLTSRGTHKQFFHAGDAFFTLQGKQTKLPFYADDRKKITDMSAFFTDDLTGKETYGAGRYVDVEKFGAYPPKTVTIDFNDAYNPNCARSAFYTCPVALDNIPVAVKVGERDPHVKH
ncbi:MAG TPA: DUF1684 domain-containing protein [Rhizomicrobium sp.]|nr:DUF1684 domain-containing protein [Rhizomicrobium sp.]